MLWILFSERIKEQIMIGVKLPEIVVEFMLDKHPKELPLISMFGHIELWDEKMQNEFEKWQMEKEQIND